MILLYSMITTRGCPYSCTFCYRNFGRKVRSRSANNVIAEIKTLREKYNLRFIALLDELFTVHKKRVYDFCDKIDEEKLNIRWQCAGRVNLVDESLLKRMAASGCEFILYGIESGSQKMLDSMNKQVTVDQAKKAIQITRKAGITPMTSYMVGTIGETKETIQETVDFCRDTHTNAGEFFFTTPFPTTILWEQVKAMGKIENEEKYIEKLGECSDFLINLTELPDEELISLKEEAENEISKNYKEYQKYMLRHHPFKVMSQYYRIFGFRNLLKRAVEVGALRKPVKF